MNRAILIVICDFLVSSMLAMMTGMVPAHTGGTGVGLDENTTKTLLEELNSRRTELENLRTRLRETIERLGTSLEREAELKRLNSALAANQLQQEKLKEGLNATPQNTGKLTVAELQKKLDEEKLRRMETETMLKDSSGDLSRTRENLQTTRELLQEKGRDLAVQNRELARTREVLAKASEALVDSQKNVVEARTAQIKAESRASAAEAQNRVQEKELAGVRVELTSLESRFSSEQSEKQKLQKNLAYTSGQLQVREKNYAALQDQLNETQRLLAVSELQRQEAQVQRDDMRATCKSLVTELSQQRTTNTQLAIDKAKAETSLKYVEKALKESSPQRSDVIARYGASVIHLRMEIAESRMLGEQKAVCDSFLPVVDFNGKKLIIGSLNRFAGDAETALHFQKVTVLRYQTAMPVAKAAFSPLDSPLLLLSGEPRAAAFLYKGNAAPLKLMTYEELKKQGTEGLYFFKCRSLGKESAKLDGRVSLSMAPGEHQLFVRNAGRSGNEMRIEPGDFVLSRDGRFVGIAVAWDNADGSRVQGVKVQLFDSGKAWDNAKEISVTKAGNETYFSRFAAEMTALRKTIDADSRRR